MPFPLTLFRLTGLAYASRGIKCPLPSIVMAGHALRHGRTRFGHLPEEDTRVKPAYDGREPGSFTARRFSCIMMNWEWLLGLE